jgi:co-chaperonin GroES (HSP10)
MKLKPLGNRVVLKPIEKTQTQDGIYIPDSIKDKPMHFTV